MVMIAVVREVRAGSLLVRDRATGQNVVVNTDQTRCIFPGDLVGILYNGVMTNSLPPQISALRIQSIFSRGNCR